MTDVAARAGVSHQTVSRVLNGSPNVAPRTRARVLTAIDELGYRRNMAARALVTGRSEAVGVLAPSTGLYGPASIVAALGSAVATRGMTLSVEHLLTFDATSIRNAVTRLVDQRVAGIVVVAAEESATIALAAMQVGIPMISVDGPTHWNRGNVAVDQQSGARLATEYLLSRGHRSIWHVAGPAGWHDAAARERGWRLAMQAAGVEPPPVVRGEWSAASGYEAGALLARIPECTAVFAASDAIALGVVRALVQHGRRVPGDVSIVGFDDVPEAAYFLPPLTTVRQEFAELGRAALDVLLGQLGDATSPASSRFVQPVLIERESVSTLPRG